MSHFDARLMPGSFWVNLQTKTETTNQAITGVLAEIKTIREAPGDRSGVGRSQVILDRQLPAAI